MIAPHYAMPADWTAVRLLLESQQRNAQQLVTKARDPDGRHATAAAAYGRALHSIATMGLCPQQRRAAA